MDAQEKAAAKYKSKNLMGFIQDKVDVGMAKLRTDEGVALDVAVVKATLQDEVVPKEKHVHTLKVACSGSAPRQQVNYVINALAKRLEEKSGWIVTLKTLIVFHRLMREVDPSFQVCARASCNISGACALLSTRAWGRPGLRSSYARSTHTACCRRAAVLALLSWHGCRCHASMLHCPASCNSMHLAQLVRRTLYVNSAQDEIIRFQERTGAHRLLRLDGFADHLTKETWDYSAWIRVYRCATACMSLPYILIQRMVSDS